MKRRIGNSTFKCLYCATSMARQDITVQYNSHWIQQYTAARNAACHRAGTGDDRTLPAIHYQWTNPVARRQVHIVQVLHMIMMVPLVQEIHVWEVWSNSRIVFFSEVTRNRASQTCQSKIFNLLRPGILVCDWVSLSSRHLEQELQQNTPPLISFQQSLYTYWYRSI